MKVLITGGTGTVGRMLVGELLKDPDVELIRVLGRSEFRTLQFQQDFGRNPRVEVVTGDVSDFRSIQFNCHGVDVVYHLAAMKHVDLVERDPYLAMRTNIEGTKNIVEASIRTDVKRVVMMSTDKAVHASSLYGSTKLVAEKIALSGNRIQPMFNILRSGNVINSSGAVFEVWQQQLRNDNVLRVTDPDMTRFLVPKPVLGRWLRAMCNLAADLILVPKAPAARVGDLAQIFIDLFGDANTTTMVVGKRPGEKEHEDLISVEELERTSDRGDHYLVTGERLEQPLAAVPCSSDLIADLATVRELVEHELRADGML